MRHEDGHAASVAEGLRRLGLDLPATAGAQLTAYADLLRKRAVPFGMLGPHEADRIVPRHVVDSLRAVAPLASVGPRSAVDLGSGAGLPGIPLAVALPDVAFTLAEPRGKRAAFLELVVERLELSNVSVHADPAETLPPARFDAAVARAFASPQATWKAAARLLRPGGALILFAGSGTESSTPLEGAASIQEVETGSAVELVEGVREATSDTIPLASDGHLVMIRKT
ncbi:MAG TPA: 16S rRNA (guanine(527)-N(7))-methyltransferase RsmG [Actinomycetota bacterium]|nr:16S rRNA (guanine(527)-N(7))-methyltransferase RsmG [Actinomycetota bacterium]